MRIIKALPHRCSRESKICLNKQLKLETVPLQQRILIKLIIQTANLINKGHKLEKQAKEKYLMKSSSIFMVVVGLACLPFHIKFTRESGQIT